MRRSWRYNDLTSLHRTMTSLYIMAAFSSARARTPSIRISLPSLRRFSISTELRHDERSDFFGKFITEHQPPQKTINYFSNLEWTRKVLENKNYEIVPFFSRHHNAQTGENRLFGQIVNTSTAIPHLLSLRPKNLITPSILLQNEKQQRDDAHQKISNTPPDAICLISLDHDLDAHPSIVHGGFQAVLFDEIMRFVILLHQDQVCQPGPRDIHYTVKMSISYCAHVTTPGDVLVRCWLTGREGRKWFTGAEIVDSGGNVLTMAESMWVTARHGRV